MGGFFELETVGSARVEGGVLQGSRLVTVTTFAVFENPQDLQAFVNQSIGD
jgi:hypothetical protein